MPATCYLEDKRRGPDWKQPPNFNVNEPLACDSPTDAASRLRAESEKMQAKEKPLTARLSRGETTCWSWPMLWLPLFDNVDIHIGTRIKAFRENPDSCGTFLVTSKSQRVEKVAPLGRCGGKAAQELEQENRVKTGLHDGCDDRIYHRARQSLEESENHADHDQRLPWLFSAQAPLSSDS